MTSLRISPARGFTLIELLVVIGIISLLMGILLPLTTAVRARAYETRCANNLRQIGAGMVLHEQLYHRLPPAREEDKATWQLMHALGSDLIPWEGMVLATGVCLAENLRCPLMEARVDAGKGVPWFGLSYAMNRYYAGGVLSRAAAKSVLVAEVNPHLGLQYVGPDAIHQGLLARRHSAQGNWLFFDNSVQRLSPDEALGANGEGWGADQRQLLPSPRLQ